MPRRPLYTKPRLPRSMPPRTEWHAYRQLSRDVLLVIAGFIVLGLLMALAADLIPYLMAG